MTRTRLQIGLFIIRLAIAAYIAMM